MNENQLINEQAPIVQQINDAAVKSYFDNAKGGTAATISMMTHEFNLPASSGKYRLKKEVKTINDWLNNAPDSGTALDVGCGAGAWTEIFASRYKSVTGIEQSNLMLKAAKERVAHLPNVKILAGDGRKDLPAASFDIIFLGGLCMYLNDKDVVALLNSLTRHLKKGGSIILRESTLNKGVSLTEGEYQAVYRSVKLYRELINRAGSFQVEERRNYGYTHLVTAEEVVNLRRKWLPFLPKDSKLLGSLTWWALRGTTPVSFWILPRVFSKLEIQWPELQNHFFRLRLKE